MLSLPVYPTELALSLANDKENEPLNECLRIVKLSIRLAGLFICIGASCSAFAQNKTIGFKPGAVFSQGRVVGDVLFSPPQGNSCHR